MRENSSTKKVKIQLVGALGKMGTILSELTDKDPDALLCDDGDIVIDFSSPEGTMQAISLEKPLVCGTTGLDDSAFASLQKLSKKVPVLYSPNFSLGMALCFQISKSLGDKVKNFCTVSIEETHHLEKKDSPSGTALELSQLLNTPNIQSNRVDDIVGIHEIKFQFPEETLTITHEAHSRMAFAQGALASAKFLFNKPPGFYKLSDVFC